MPRHAKHTKKNRDLAMMRGIRKHFAGETFRIDNKLWTGEKLLDLFQRHVDALRQVDRSYAAFRSAVLRETELEAQLKAALFFFMPLLRSRFGRDGSPLHDFGIRPRGKPRIPVATQAAAVERRRATRQLRAAGGQRRAKD